MSSSLKGCTFTRWSRSYSQSSITSTMKCFNSYKNKNNQSNSPCKRRFVCPPYLFVIQVDHIFTSPKQCEDAYLSLQILPNFWILLEKLFPNHFHSHLHCTFLQSWGGGEGGCIIIHKGWSRVILSLPCSTRGIPPQTTPFRSCYRGATHSLHSGPDPADRSF